RATLWRGAVVRCPRRPSARIAGRVGRDRPADGALSGGPERAAQFDANCWLTTCCDTELLFAASLFDKETYGCIHRAIRAAFPRCSRGRPSGLEERFRWPGCGVAAAALPCSRQADRVTVIPQL